MPGEVGRGAVVGELVRGRLCLEARGPAVLELRELVAGDRAALGSLQRVRVVREPGLQLRVRVEDEGERGQRQHDAEAGSERLSVRPDAARRPLAERGDGQHRQRGAERVGDRDRDRLPAQVHAGRVRRDRADDRPAAGDEDEAEARAEQEAAAEVAVGAAPAQARQRPLDPHADAREDQAGRDEEQQPDREVAEEVLRQVELAQQPGRDQRERGEARDEPGDDRVRPAGVRRSRRRRTGSAARGTRTARPR